MATDLPPNLDEVVSWLPSEIISDVCSPRRPPPSRSTVEAIAAFSPLNPNPRHDLAEGLLPQFGFGRVRGAAPVAAGAYMPVHHFGPVHPQPQMVVDGFGQRVVQGPAQFYGVRVNGSGRTCGGTGVFFPRVKNEVKKKPTNAKAEQKLVAVKKVKLPPSPELSLPAEWTY